MKFGIFYEISVPRPWGPTTEYEVYQNCLEQVKLADELGFDQVWAVEHHFLEEYSHCSAPEVFLTACAMVTKNIRIGRGIVVCVPEFNSPIKAAEVAATMDIVSGGRLEFGTGRSATWTELGGMGADPDETKKTWDEWVRVIPKMWTEERFGYQGRAFSMPQRAVLPKPLQKPHPPMWVAVTSPGTELDAADRGMGSLGLTFGGFAEQEKKIAEYRRRIRYCDPVGSFVNEQVNTVNFLFCHEDNEYGAKTGQRLAGTFNYLAEQLLAARQAYPTRSYPNLGLLPALRREATSAPEGQIPEGLCIGNPDRIVEVVRKWESVGVDRINFLLNAIETVPQEEVLASLRLFAKEVMPKFAEKPTKATVAVGGD
ncbi:LLM class flavin-dependent oxidoreductase [Tepidiforma sp.]|uniref:LLM class flavin-dependent oxidoreductase n=1 Tax=Tepidiforma sp. TaxID=2682230 RepID=UPI002ADDCEC0|nr:LLM class flavin-dependent oxidoreductase [Tepidiforma sp.]